VDDSELREALDGLFDVPYEMDVLHTERHAAATADAVDTDHETTLKVTAYPEATTGARAEFEAVADALDGLRLREFGTREYLGDEKEAHGTFVLQGAEPWPDGDPPSDTTAAAERAVAGEEPEGRRRGQGAVETGHEATRRLYREDAPEATTHVLRVGGGGAACGHEHGGTAVAAIAERYESLREFLSDDRCCRACGAILIRQLNLPPGRVPGRFREAADG
jgi:hypothetical protein